MYCADCGAQNPDDGAFCAECGIRLAVSLDAEDTQQLPSVQAAPPPRTLRAILERAHELADADDLDGAVDMCRRAVIMEPRSRAAHALLGLLYEKKGYTKFAIREYQVVLEIDPRSAAEREKLEMLLEQEKEETDSFAPVAASAFWSRWRIAVLGGAAALACGVVAIIVHFARQADRPSSSVQPIALNTTASQRSADLYQPTTNVGSATRANPPYTQAPYPVRMAGISPFQAPNWQSLARQPGAAQADVPIRPRAGGRPEITVPRVVEPSPWWPPGTGPGAPNPTEDRAPPGTTPTGTFEAVEGPPPPPPPGETQRPGILEIELLDPTRTASNTMFQPVDPDQVPTTTGEDEKAGRAAQVEGLRLKSAGRHGEAITKFRAAIADYEREIEKHGASEKLLRAIETCKHGIEYSESRLRGP